MPHSFVSPKIVWAGETIAEFCNLRWKRRRAQGATLLNDWAARLISKQPTRLVTGAKERSAGAIGRSPLRGKSKELAVC